MSRNAGPGAVLAACLALVALPAFGQAPRPLVPEIGETQTTPAPQLPSFEPAPAIAVEPLAPGDPASVGLLRVAPAPVPFSGSSSERLSALLARLGFPLPAEAVREQVVRLLAAPWSGASGGQALLLARARALMAHGAGNEAAELVLLPAAGMTESAEARLLAAEALAEIGSLERACLVAEPLPPASPAVVALDFACAFLTADSSRAGLVLELAGERGLELPQGFLALAEAALAGKPLPLQLSDDSTRPASLLLLSRLPLALEEPVAAGADPTLLRVVAANQQVAPALRLDAAERASSLGVLPLSELRELMQQLAPAELTQAPPDGPLGRAALLRALFAEAVPAARATLLQRAMPAVPAGVERVRWLELLAPAAAALPVERSLLWAVDGILPPLLAAGAFTRAAEWLQLAHSHEAAESAARAVRGAAVLAGLMPLPQDGNGPMLQRALLAALARGLGIQVPDVLWTQLAAEEPLGAPVPPPSVSLWAIASDALAAGRTGEAILAALALLGPAPEAAAPPVLAHSLAVLRQAGEADLARRLAVAIALALRL